MLEASPFRGIRYNQRIVGDLAQVLCPPYDVITPELRQLLYNKSDYNAVRLESPADGLEPTEDSYQRASITFQDWRQRGVLQLDTSSSFYLHDHHFEYAGQKRVRRGLVARIKLEPWGSGIYPHEETFPKAKSDRLQLMRACRANFSPVLSLYQDSEREAARILSEASRAKPTIEISLPSSSTGVSPDEGSEAHTLWAITDPETKLQLTRFLSSQRLYVADGHHRYETALAYQQERTQAQSDSCKLPGDGFHYVMMELVDFSDPGLVVLPVHRLVRGMASSALAALQRQLEHFFALEFVSLSEGFFAPGDSQPLSLSVITTKSTTNGKQSDRHQDIISGILGLHAGALVLLRRRQDISLDDMMPDNRSGAYREFGVSILNHIILDKMLGITSKEDVVYTVDWKAAYQQIKEGKYQLAFLMNPPQPEMIKAIAGAQDRMPAKSTYFHPKLPAGLIINPLD
ncbi:MAG: DUF1015 domain-containing protein [Dehalococcoidia bacterium]